MNTITEKITEALDVIKAEQGKLLRDIETKEARAEQIGLNADSEEDMMAAARFAAEADRLRAEMYGWMQAESELKLLAEMNEPRIEYAAGYLERRARIETEDAEDRIEEAKRPVTCIEASYFFAKAEHFEWAARHRAVAAIYAKAAEIIRGLAE